MGRRWEGAVVGGLAGGCESLKVEGLGRSLQAEEGRRRTGVAVVEEALGSTAVGC